VGGGWALSVLDGRPARRIVDAARSVDARAVVMGMGRHGFLERFLGSETLLKVIRLSHLPVLGLPADAEDLPHRGVVAVDFSELSRRAARTAVPFLKDPGQLHLIHVMSGFDALPEPSGDWREAYRSQVASRLKALRRELDVGEEWTVVTSVRSGEAADEVTAYAEEVDAGLVALGSHGYSSMGRLILGSVSTRIVRRTGRGVLVVPPGEAPPEAGVEHGGDAGHPEWTKLLADFTRRNRGRPVALELSDPELGVQSAGSGFRLSEIRHEPGSARILVLLSRPGEDRDHLAHGISTPVSLEVTSGETDEVEALRVELERGAVVLRVLES